MSGFRLDKCCRDRASSWVFLGAALCACAAFGALYLGENAPSLQALATSGDTDGDGIPDLQERVLLSNTAADDSDGDGFGDLEEFARGSSPIDEGSTPPPNKLSVQISARGEAGKLRIFIAIYQPVQYYGQYDLSILTLNGSRLLHLPLWYLERSGNPQYNSIFVDSELVGVVKTYDMPVSPLTVVPGHSFSWAAVTTEKFGANSRCASVVDIFNLDGVHCLRVATGGSNAAQPESTQNSLYRPIPPNGLDKLNLRWEEAQICSRYARIVGFQENGITTQEVESAACEFDAAALCNEVVCSSGVGTTFQTLDAGILAGQ